MDSAGRGGSPRFPSGGHGAGHGETSGSPGHGPCLASWRAEWRLRFLAEEGLVTQQRGHGDQVSTWMGPRPHGWRSGTS